MIINYYPSNGPDAIGIPDKRSKDHVDALFDAKKQILFVLIGHGRQVTLGAGQVASLPGSQLSAILHLSDDEIVPDFLGDDRDESVVDEDLLSDRQHLRQVLVIQVDDLVGAFFFVGLVGGQFDVVARLQVDFLSAVVALQQTGTDFGTLNETWRT